MISFSQTSTLHNLLTVAILITTGLCLEDNRPALFLPPRHFNPHPYQATFDPRAPSPTNPGPVVFPPSPLNDDEVNNNRIDIGHPVDEHPYPIVARKRKFQVAGRFNDGQDNNINPRVYQGLSSYAAKVLSAPPSTFSQDYTLSSLPSRKNFATFGYKVVDHLRGDDFSHIQSQNAATTNGEYRVKLPDGRLQIVSYVADKNGYKADVKYTQNIQIEPKRRQEIPLDYDYALGTFYRPLPKTVHDYVSPKNVQIYNNGAGNSPALSSIAPFIARATIAPTLDGYSEVYVQTPKFKFTQSQQHDEIYGK